MSQGPLQRRSFRNTWGGSGLYVFGCLALQRSFVAVVIVVARPDYWQHQYDQDGARSMSMSLSNDPLMRSSLRSSHYWQ